MKKMYLMVLGVLMLAACGAPPAPAEAPATGPAAAVPVQPPPVFALIGTRERLNLTSQQISALDSIGTWNSSANEVVLRELRQRAPRDRRITDPAVDSMVMVIRENNLQAVRTVQSLLSEEQRSEVCEIFRSPEQRGTRAQQPRAGAPGDPMGFGPRRYVWPWCVENATPDPEVSPAEDAPPTEASPDPPGSR